MITRRSGRKARTIHFPSLVRRSNRFLSMLFSVLPDIVHGSSAVSGGQPEGDSCIADNPDEDMQQTGWSLKHVHGEWRTHAFAQVGRVCAASGDPKVVVPRTLTHAVPLPIPWAALRKTVARNFRRVCPARRVRAARHSIQEGRSCSRRETNRRCCVVRFFWKQTRRETSGPASDKNLDGRMGDWPLRAILDGISFHAAGARAACGSRYGRYRI